MGKTNFIQKNMEIRKMLQDIIEVAYKKDSSEAIEKYKKFFLEFNSKQVKSFAGRYFPHNKHIEIVGLERPTKHIIITTLHELSHHIDHMQRGKSDHSPTFYAIYEKLIFAALDMGIISFDDINSVSDVSDRNKIKKMLLSYERKEVNYKNDIYIISIYNSYSIKEFIKRRGGYRWDGLSMTWNKECDINTLNEEKNFLDSLGAEYQISDAKDYNVKAVGKLIVKGGFEFKEILHTNGFYFKKEEKVWERILPYSEMEDVMQKLRAEGLPDNIFKKK